MSLTQAEYEKFIKVTKRILKTGLSENKTTLQKYRTDIIEARNIFLKFVNKHYASVNQEKQAKFEQKLKDAREKFERCLKALKCTYELPVSLFEEIEENSIGEILDDSRASTSAGISSGRTSVSIVVNPPTPTSSEHELNINDFVESEIAESFYEDADDTNIDMTETEAERLERQEREREARKLARMAELKAQKDLLDIVNGQIRKPYDGEPMGLQTFLTGVEIAKDFADTPALQTKLVTYVKGRLEGKARQLVTDDIENIDDLIAALKSAIRPENSKIIEARIAALHYTYSKQEEFTKRAEELADALRRTLIIEGMTAEKANDITIERTVKLCRKSTNSDVVKAVLSASTFTSAKEVVAKLITSNDEAVKEKKILRYHKDKGSNGQARGRFKGRGYSNQRGGRGSYNNYNNGNRYNNFRKGNNFRGRGNNNQGGRGYYNNNNNRYQNQQNGNNGNWRVNQNQNVRLTQSGNASVPQALMEGPQIRQIE